MYVLDASNNRETVAGLSYTNWNFQSAGLQYPYSLAVGAACDSHNEPHADDFDIECGDVAVSFSSDGSVQNTGFTIEYKLVANSNWCGFSQPLRAAFASCV